MILGIESLNAIEVSGLVKRTPKMDKLFTKIDIIKRKLKLTSFLNIGTESEPFNKRFTVKKISLNCINILIHTEKYCHTIYDYWRV